MRPTPRDASAPSVRPLPTVLALLAFVPLALLLWWALAGPRPEPSALDWAALGLEVDDDAGAPPDFPVVHDLEWVRSQMTGWQGDIGGQLEQPLPVAEGRYTAVVRKGDGTALTPLPDLGGVVEWTVEGEATRCAFADPVSLRRVGDALEDPEVEVETTALSGRCTDDGPLVAVPVVRRHEVPLSAFERLAGLRSESALVPEGVLLVHPDGTISAEEELDPGIGLPVYPWEVARGALVQAEPGNPAAAVGAWADPIYPVLVPAGDRLWWVMPLAPIDGASRIGGYLLTAADEQGHGALNPVAEHWLDEPQVGPVAVVERTRELLDQLGGIEDAAIRPTVPSAEGDWHGRVGTAGDPLRYVIEASAGGEVCLSEPDGSTVSCRHAGDVSRR